MAADVIVCPECEKRFKGKPGMEGKRVKCPACGQGFTVPGGAAAPAAAVKAKAPAKEKEKEKEKDDDKGRFELADEVKAPPKPAASAIDLEFDDRGPKQYGVTDL